MNSHADTTPLLLSIAAVERDTGLGKDTLRVWERRYGFPAPGRDGYGERTYSLVQVEKLRVIKRLMDLGHRPGRIVPLPIEELQRLSQGMPAAPQNVTCPEDEVRSDLRAYIQRIQAHDAAGLRRGLNQALATQGLSHFVNNVVAPLTGLVGDGWMRGEMAVFEEHLYTECMSGLLRHAIGTLSEAGGAQQPAILLTTFPQESHGLGLLMAECMMVLQGARCLSLGTQTPLRDIVKAAQAHQSDVVALSFSVSLNPNHVLDGLEELRRALPAEVEIWAGGRSPILQRRAQKGVVVVRDLSQIAPQIQRWRERNATV